MARIPDGFIMIIDTDRFIIDHGDNSLSLPTKDIELVICKHCKHSEHWYGDKGICYLWNEDHGNSVFLDGFCNYGERRE